MKRLFGFVVIIGIVVSFISCKVSAKNDNDEKTFWFCSYVWNYCKFNCL